MDWGGGVQRRGQAGGQNQEDGIDGEVDVSQVRVYVKYLGVYLGFHVEDLNYDTFEESWSEEAMYLVAKVFV